MAHRDDAPNPWKERLEVLRRREAEEAAERATALHDEQLFNAALEELIGPRPTLPDKPTPKQRRLFELRLGVWEQEKRNKRIELDAVEMGRADLGLQGFPPPPAAHPASRKKRRSDTAAAIEPRTGDERSPSPSAPAVLKEAETPESPSKARRSGCPWCEIRHRGITHAAWELLAARLERAYNDTHSYSKAAKRVQDGPKSSHTVKQWITVYQEIRGAV